MSMPSATLRERVERLSSQGRSLLAAQLATVAHDSADSAAQLVAWVVTRAGAHVDEAELAKFASRHLPEHMVPSRIVILDEMPRLPNGKIDAAALPDPGRPLAAAGAEFTPPRTDRERALAGIWSEVLGTDRIDIHDNFFELGGDSILSIQVVARARRAGLHLTPDLVFEHQTLAALAMAVATEETSHTVSTAQLETAPLSPIQAWFFEQPVPAPHHWHQVVILDTRPGFDRDRFRRALDALIRHHHALRLTFRRDGSRWTQHLADVWSVPIDEIVVGESIADTAGAAENAAHAACASTDLCNAPLLRALLMSRDGHDVQHLVLAVHHLVIDGVSWNILLEDLHTLYASDGEAASLDAATSILDWNAALENIAGEKRFDAAAAYWSVLPRAPLLPRDTAGVFLEETALTISDALDREETAALLGDVHAAYNTNVEDVLLAALGRTIAHWAGLSRVLIGVERHGREQLVDGVDLSRTIGWLTSYFPVCFDVPADQDSGALLRKVKDTLRSIPHRGASYGVLRYLRGDDIVQTLSRHQPPEIVFNFAGRSGGQATNLVPWLQSRPPFASRAGVNGRGYRMEINALVIDGRLRIDWTASRTQYHESTIEHLVRTLLDEIRLLMQYALTTDSSGYTPADFPDAGLSQEDLDRFLEGLG